jgi:xylan 1,4-beta-xylosidase
MWLHRAVCAKVEPMTTLGRFILSLLCILSLGLSGARIRATAQDHKTETIRVDVRAKGEPFPHFWEQMFGSGRAILALRESYLNDLRDVKAVTDVKYIRFHAILNDEVGVYDEDASGKPIYNFSYVDQIYDGLLKAGVRPFVELSFMPKKLAAEPNDIQAFWYKPIVSPPKDYGRWAELVSQLARHLIDRYGIEEVSQWYFEVWNEPNLDFWAGVPKDQSYYQLYDAAARALKSVSPRLRVGGPATAQAAWADRFIEHIATQNVPADFVSTHVYGNDSAKDVFGTEEEIPRTEMVCRAVKKVHDQIKASARPQLPLIWSEYNASYKNEPEITDSIYMGPWIANTIRECDGMTEMMSYWTFSDVFEEQGVVKKPFYGGYGLIAEDDLPKPAFNAFKMLHHLGNTRLPVNADDVLATRTGDGSIVIAAWNQASSEGTGGEPKHITLQLDSLTGQHRASVYRLDADHGSPAKAYAAMGSPDYPSQAQIQTLRNAAKLPPPSSISLTDGRLTLDLAADTLLLVEIQ